MYLLQGWSFERGFNFMSGAVTGGAIVFPADPPKYWSTRCFATIVASLGVGLFSFMVALLSNSMSQPLVQALGLGRESRNICGKLGALTAMVVVVNLAVALIF